MVEGTVQVCLLDRVTKYDICTVLSLVGRISLNDFAFVCHLIKYLDRRVLVNDCERGFVICICIFSPFFVAEFINVYQLLYLPNTQDNRLYVFWCKKMALEGKRHKLWSIECVSK